MVYALAAWSVFVWSTRIRNIFDDGEVQGTSEVVSLASSVALLVLAVAVVAVARLRPGSVGPVLAVLVGGTVAVWAVRVPLIAASASWGVPFKVVHTGLAVVSLVLAHLAWRAVRRSGPPAGERAPGSSPVVSSR